VLVLVRVRVRQILELGEEQGVFEDPLDRFDQVGLQGSRVLLLGVAGQQELLQRLVSLVWSKRGSGRGERTKWGK